MECRAAPRPDDPRYHREDLLGDILDVVLPLSHPLADRAEIDLAELRDADVGGAARRLVVRRGVHGRLPRAGFTPRIAHRSGDWQAVMGLVAADLGISLVPRLAHNVTPPDVTIVRLDRRRAAPARLTACRAARNRARRSAWCSMPSRRSLAPTMVRAA